MTENDEKRNAALAKLSVAVGEFVSAGVAAFGPRDAREIALAIGGGAAKVELNVQLSPFVVRCFLVPAQDGGAPIPLFDVTSEGPALVH